MCSYKYKDEDDELVYSCRKVTQVQPGENHDKRFRIFFEEPYEGELWCNYQEVETLCVNYRLHGHGCRTKSYQKQVLVTTSIKYRTWCGKNMIQPSYLVMKNETTSWQTLKLQQ